MDIKGDQTVWEAANKKPYFTYYDPAVVKYCGVIPLGKCVLKSNNAVDPTFTLQTGADTVAKCKAKCEQIGAKCKYYQFKGTGNQCKTVNHS